jgi:hypothetical protein
MLRMFKPGSPMSVGVWSLTFFSLPLTLIVVVDLLTGAGLRGLHLTLVVIGIVPALAAAVYKGVSLSTSAQPGWSKARWLGGYLTSAAVGPGAALLILLAIVRSSPGKLTIREGATLGTVLRDLERRRPVDLLLERSASALRDWLQNHPEVEVICRDRGDKYIKGASERAPHHITTGNLSYLAFQMPR